LKFSQLTKHGVQYLTINVVSELLAVFVDMFLELVVDAWGDFVLESAGGAGFYMCDAMPPVESIPRFQPSAWCVFWNRSCYGEQSQNRFAWIMVLS
jgi:hypothetical protein